MENYTWKLGSFTNGDIIDDIPLYVINEPEIDVSVDNEDTATLSILMTPYSDTIRNSWASYFKEVLHFCVAIGEDSGEVLWAGMINKITPSIAEQTLEFQLVNPKEYTSARIVGETFGEVVEDPTSGVEISGANYSEIVAELVRRCFTIINRPNTPQPPNILFSASPAKTGSTKKMTFLYSDMVSYSEAIDNAINESGLDIETRYSAVWANSEKTRINWEFTCASESAPHINEALSLSIQLRDAENIRKVSEFENLVDSTELFNSFYISSKQGSDDDKNGMDLKNAVNYSSDFPILLETYYSPGIELSETQINSQLSSYISQGMNTKRTGAITLELESEDFVLWAKSYLGRIITFTGYDNTLSAGYSSALRCVGVRFDLSAGRVLIDLMSKQPRYPKLPRKKGAKSKKKTDKNKTTPSNRLVKAKDVSKFKGGGGGLPPTPPWEGGGTYPPSGAGPGGGYGTGSETDKDDLSPYEISNHGTKWMETEEFRMGLYNDMRLNTKNLCQNLSNVLISWRIRTRPNYYWKFESLNQTMENGYNSGSLDTLAGSNFTDFGTGYFDNGAILGFENNRFSQSIDSILNSVLADPNRWGFNIPNTMPTYVSYSRAGIYQMNYSEGGCFSIRDNIFFAINIELTPFYKNSSGSVMIGDRVSKIVFFTRKLNSWNDLGTPVPQFTGTMNGKALRASRVGDWGIVQNEIGYNVNNFSQIELMNPWNWYNIPLPDSISGIPVNKEEMPTIGTLKIQDTNLIQNYLITTGNENNKHKIFGLKLLATNQPLPVQGAIWEDVSELFPVPTSNPEENSVRIDSLSGYLMTRISGSTAFSTSVREEVYMQDDTGIWRAVAGDYVPMKNIEQYSNWPGYIYTAVFQFKDWFYYIEGSGTSTSGGTNATPRAFHFRKVAEWAVGSETQTGSVGSVPPSP